MLKTCKAIQGSVLDMIRGGAYMIIQEERGFHIQYLNLGYVEELSKKQEATNAVLPLQCRI